MIARGPSSHTLIEGNHCHHNNGAGIAFRGDDATRGGAWRPYHWIIQNNDLHDNRWGIWGRWGDWMFLANNHFARNPEGNFLKDVARLVEVPPQMAVRQAPVLRLRGPERARVGQPVCFDASKSRDPEGRPLAFRWDVEAGIRLQGSGGQGSGARGRGSGRALASSPELAPGPSPPTPVSSLTHTFPRPGFYRVGVTASNGALAALGYRDVLAVDAGARECGTEGEAARWGFELEDNRDGRGKIRFMDSTDAICGHNSLRFRPDPYPGAYATAIYPATRDAVWDLSKKHQLSFWIKGQDPNWPGWQNPGPVIRLYGKAGVLTYTPSGGRNLLADPPYSEARWTWMRVVVPLAGSSEWERKETGTVTLSAIEAVGLSLDSWGWAPFTVWVDGLVFE